MTSRSRRESGFTLYEVIVVLVVIALVAGVVVPSFGGVIPSVKVSRAGDTLLAAAGKARADAALTGRRHRIRFEKDPAPLWRLEFEVDPLQAPGTWRRCGDWLEELPEGVTFEKLDGTTLDALTGQEVLEFLPDGRSSEAELVLAHERGGRIAIQVAAADGRAKIVDPTEEQP